MKIKRFQFWAMVAYSWCLVMVPLAFLLEKIEVPINYSNLLIVYSPSLLALLIACCFYKTLNDEDYYYK